jgi:5-hydroxyisourate hydrolase-like protein (transthyretin family)
MSILVVGLILFQLQQGTVSGIVTRPGGIEPLPGATVILQPAISTQTSRIRSTISEDDGRFTLSDIEPGEYRLQVQSPYYGSAAYGQRRLDGPGSVLTIAAGQRVTDLKVSMPPSGAIAGRITGLSGESLAYASVQAMRYLYQEGKRVLAVVQTTTTDDRGEYRLFWLPGGKYIVVAAPRSSPTRGGTSIPARPGEATRTTGDLPLTPILLGLAPNQMPAPLFEGTNLVQRILEDGTIREESWMPTYYPATTDRTQALAVDVAAGSTVTGIDIALGPSPVQKIRGRVVSSTSVSQASVALALAGQGTPARIMSKSVSPVDGSFELAGVLPGSYFLMAQDRSGLVSTPAAVLVGDRDVEDVSLALAPTLSVFVRITAEGLTAEEWNAFPGISGSLRPELDATLGLIRTVVGSGNALLKPGSALVFQNVPPGEYQFHINQPVINQAPPREDVKRLYVKSIRFGREDALGSFRVSADTKDVPLEVVLTTETGAVEGVAIGRTGDPAPNVTVVLVPATARKRTALYKTLVTGSDGRFRFQEIPPGDYKLFAWDDIETGAWQDTEFVRPYESRSRAIRVSGSNREEVQLNVIYYP